ncbi:hypothetical protein D9M70_458870 [compost metagenome]
MRRQREHFAGAERAPLHLVAQHAGPADAVRDPARGGQFAQRAAPAGAVRPGDHEVRGGHLRGFPREGLDQQVAAFFRVDAAEEQHQALAAQRGMRGEEALGQAAAVGRMRRRRRTGAEADHAFVGAIQPEGFAGAPAFFFRGEQHRARVAQHAVFRPGPVQPLLQVLERVSAAKPRVEHAVREHEVRHAAVAQRLPGSKTVVLPQPVDDDRVKALRVFAQPRQQRRAVAVAAARGPERMHRQAGVAQPRRIGCVERQHLDPMALRGQRDGALAHALGGTALAGIERWQQLQDLHARGPCRVSRGATGADARAGDKTGSRGGCGAPGRVTGGRVAAGNTRRIVRRCRRMHEPTSSPSATPYSSPA